MITGPGVKSMTDWPRSMAVIATQSSGGAQSPHSHGTDSVGQWFGEATPLPHIDSFNSFATLSISKVCKAATSLKTFGMGPKAGSSQVRGDSEWLQ